ncbi:exo-alpha-sialidase [Arenibacter sp. N53]|nr:exo-alpha-sialidase [Arenibacter sp. N53]
MNIKVCYVFLILTMLHNLCFGQLDKSFLDPPKLIKNPSSVEYYTPESRKFTGISSLAVSPNGRLWATWYSGITPGEDANNYVVVSTSADNGQTWEEVFVIDSDKQGPVRAFDPEVWIDPAGKLWIFWSQSIHKEMDKHYDGINTGVWVLTVDDAEDGNPSWPTPKRIIDGIMMCKPIVLSTGEWVLPVSTWQINDGAKAVMSMDSGKSWQIRGAVNVPELARNADEHMIVERKNGTLWMLVRTKYGIGESISKDKGYSWTPLIPSKIQHPTARFFIYRLNSGNLLLVKHGPIDMKIGRSHLMAFISKDDGFSWSDGLLLDERKDVSYPDGQQSNDGTIYITYDYNRRSDQEIFITSFSEEDVVLGSSKTILAVYNRRMLVSKGGAQ